MQPNQSPQNPWPPQAPSPSYPPQPGGAPQPYPQQPAQQPPQQPQASAPSQQAYGQQPMQQPQQQFYSPVPNLQQPQANTSTTAANWYKPPEKKADTSPASVDTYLGRNQEQQQAQQTAPRATGPVPGQVINGQYAVDYLGGIAPKQAKNTIKIAGKSINKTMFWGAIGGVIALLLAATLFILTPKQTGVANLNESSLFRSLVSTSEITKKAGRNIKSSKLRAVNSSFTSLLIGSAKEMQDPLSKSGLDPKKLESEAKKPSKDDTKVIDTLESARLNAMYDNAYNREMQHRIRTMLITLDRIQKMNNNKGMQEFVKNTRPKLETIQKLLEEEDL